MTVKELIEKLSELDPELHVFTHAYEGGYNDIKISDIKEIALNVYSEWYYGKHEEVALLSLSVKKENKKVVQGIIL